MSKKILTDDLLKEALQKAMGIKLMAYDNRLEKEENHTFSEEYREKMRAMLQGSDGKEEARPIRSIKRKKHIRLKAALIAAIIMLMGAVTVLAVEPLREKVYQIIEKNFSDHTDINVKELGEAIDSEKREITPESFELKRLVNVPEQYEVEYEELVQEVCDYILIYTDDKEESIVYQQQGIEYMDSWSITSDGTGTTTVSVHGDVGYVLEDEHGWVTVIYPHEGYVYSLAGREEAETLAAILETIFE